MTHTPLAERLTVELSLLAGTRDTTLAERLTLELSLLVTIFFNELGLSSLRFSLIESNDIGMPTNCNSVYRM